jgi:multiple sugar transport system permease protein
MRYALNRLAPYLLISPAVILIGFGCLYPTILAVRLGLYEWSLGEPWSAARWSGIAAFVRVLQDPELVRSFATTALFAGIVVISEMILGTALALLWSVRSAG